MSRYARGETQALDKLVTRYRLPLYHLLCRLTQCRAEADEIFQDTWLKIIKKHESFRTGSFKGWVFRIASNLAIDWLRRNRKQVSLDIPEGGVGSDGATRGENLAARSPTPDDQASHGDIRVAIERALECLTEEQREVFILRMDSDMSFRDIAELQGVSLGTALGRMHYATTKMRSLLRAHNPATERKP